MRASALSWLAVVALAAALSLNFMAAEEKPAEPAFDQSLSKANNSFGMALLRQLHKDGDNTFFSPTSIGMALQMTSLGARGETLADMTELMGTQSLDVGESNQALIAALIGRESVKLKIGNAIFADSSRIKLNRAFADSVQRKFDARIDTVSFADPKTVGIINGWVAERTEQKIPKLFEELGADTVTVLINAIYFKGDWTDSFDPKRTEEGDFHLADGSTAKAQMMSRRGSYRYADDDDAQIIALPYGKDKQMSMWVVLPKKGKSLDGIAKGLSAEQLSKWQQAATSQTVLFSVPRFKMKFRKELKDDLAEMGMPTAFTARADFSGLEEDSGGNLYINQVVHEAIIEVNEEGTVAAAATGVAIGRTSAPRHITMTCDRPFMLAIHDDRTGSVLFMGTVYKPERLN